MSLLPACSAAAGFAASFGLFRSLSPGSPCRPTTSVTDQRAARPASNGSSQQNHLRGTEVTDPRRHRAARSEIPERRQDDEGHLKFRALARVDEVAVASAWCAATGWRRRGPAATMLVEVDQCIHEPACGDRLAWRILEKSSISLPAPERISRAMPRTTRVFRHSPPR